MVTVVSISTASDDEQVLIRRYLLSAGQNNGGRDRVLLRYAVTDAKAFETVLTDMGGVDKSNAFILVNPSKWELLGGLSGMNRRVTNDKEEEPNIRTEVFVYYSGHADIDGLKLGPETLSWSEFRTAVNNIDADVRVAVLDACGSGAITRTKGGIARPAFLLDASNNMRGYAFLTSSNENEASQESDRIKGSYFTHALLNGMRGAADMTGDGRVTINEAYQYAFKETLKSTQNTTVGTQHPSRDMNLSGTGDIVMTDLRSTSAILSLGADIDGRFFIRDDKGNLFAELSKVQGRSMDFGIAPGRYTVRVETPAPSRWLVAEGVVITDGEKTTLTMNDMAPMPRRERTIRRGGSIDGVEESHESDDRGDEDELCGDDDCLTTEPADLPASQASTGASSPSLSDSPVSTAAPEDTLQPPAPRALPVTNPQLDAACRAPYRSNVGFFISSNTPANGTQFALLATDARSTFCGEQASVIVNIAREDMAGVQVSAGINVSMGGGRLTQAAPINFAAQDIKGTQIGLLNLARDRVSYAQVAAVNYAGSVGAGQYGYLNIADSAGSFQIGTINFASLVERVQWGTVNFADSVGRYQIGAVNIARSVSGAQVGLINLAETTGRPVGLINIAGHSEKTAVGLINIIGSGIFDATAYVETSADIGLMVRSGTPWLYTLIDYSQPGGYSYNWPKFFGAGFGTRFGMTTPLSMSVDAAYGVLYHDYHYSFLDWNNDVLEHKRQEFSSGWFYDQLLKSRAGVNFSATPFLGVTAGMNLNTLFASGARRWGEEYPDLVRRGGNSGEALVDEPHATKGGSDRVRVWPEFYVGLTIGKSNPTPRK